MRRSLRKKLLASRQVVQVDFQRNLGLFMMPPWGYSILVSGSDDGGWPTEPAPRSIGWPPPAEGAGVMLLVVGGGGGAVIGCTVALLSGGSGAVSVGPLK